MTNCFIQAGARCYGKNQDSAECVALQRREERKVKL
jgi:hypothetical protein